MRLGQRFEVRGILPPDCHPQIGNPAQKPRKPANTGFVMAGVTGFEPATYGFGDRGSGVSVTSGESDGSR